MNIQNNKFYILLILLVSFSCLNSMSSDAELLRAINQGNSEKIKKLVADGADINKYIVFVYKADVPGSFAVDSRAKELPLILAMRAGKPKIFGILLNLGADPHKKPLGTHITISGNYKTVFELVYDTYHVETFGNFVVIKKILEILKSNEIKKSLKVKNIPAVLIDIIFQYSKEPTLERQSRLNSDLCREASLGNIENIKKLVNCGAQVNKYVNGDGRPLACCLAGGYWQAFELLLELGANPYLKACLEKDIFDQAIEANTSWAIDGKRGLAGIGGRSKIVDILQKYKKMKEESEKTNDGLIEDYFE